MNYNEQYKTIIRRLRLTRIFENAVDFGISVFKLGIITMLVIIATIIIEFFAYGDRDFRTGLAVSIGLVFMVSIIYFFSNPIKRLIDMLRKANNDDTAKRIGARYPDIADKLCNAIQLFRNDRNSPYFSKTLALAEFEQTANSAMQKRFDIIINKKPFYRSIINSIIIATVLFLLLFFSSSMYSAFVRVVNFDKSYLPPVPYTLSMTPMDTVMLRGSKIRIIIKAEGKAPEKLNLKIRRPAQETFDNYELLLDTNNTYIYENKSLKNSIEYYAEAEWMSETVKTPIGKAKIINLPLIRSLCGKVTNPTYTKLAGKSFNEQNADISALRGAKVEISVYANKSLKAAYIIFDKVINQSNIAEATEKNPQTDTTTKRKIDTLKVKMSVKGRKATGRFFVMDNAHYHIKLIDTDNQQNINPVKYMISCLDDFSPTINQTKPTTDVTINQEGLLPINVNISDDYGFSYLRLYYRLKESKYKPKEERFSKIDIAIDKSERDASISYVWDLNALIITPEDVYEYYFEVADNDYLSGLKKATTPVLTVRLPSLDEVVDQSDKQQEYIEKQLQEALKEANEIKKELDEFNRDLLKKDKEKQLDWQEQKKAEDIVKRQQSLKQKMQELAKKLEDNTKNLDKHNMLSAETMEMYQQLQNLMKQVDSQELREMQKKMDQALKNMSQEDMKKALENFKFNEEQFRKSIERSMKILKRIQAQQKADALAKTADELAKRQDELAEESKKTNPNDTKTKEELEKKQDILKDELKKMNDELKDLENLMKEFSQKEMPMDLLEESKKALDNEKTAQEMQDAQEQMQNNQMKSAAQNMKSAAQSMKSFGQKMNAMREKMQEDQKKEAIRKMERAINDMQKLSQKQENLQQDTKDLNYNSTRLPDNARKQAELFEQLANVAMGLSELSDKSFAVTPEMAQNIQESLENMRSAVGEMQERNANSAGKAQAKAMGNMNSAIGAMQSMVGAMKQSGSCSKPGQGEGEGSGMSSGFGQKMQQLAAQQQAINQAMQQMMQGGSEGQGGQGGKGGKGGQSGDKQSEMKRLAGKQGAAGKSAQELAKEQEKFGGADSRKPLGNLNKIAQDMEEVTKDMQSGNVTQETIKRQQQILNRLLDAARSVNDRDFEKQRKAEEGKNYKLISPKELDYMSEEGRKRAYKELLENNRQGYTKDFEELIKFYYEALQKEKEN